MKGSGKNERESVCVSDKQENKRHEQKKKKK